MASAIEQVITNTSRRALLTNAALAIGVLAAMPMALGSPVTIDDGALLRAWSDLRAAHQVVTSLPIDMDEDARELEWQKFDAIQRRLVDLPARTSAGIAVKLRWLFMELGGLIEYQDAAYGNAPVTPDMLEDWRHRLVWQMIGDAERMGGAA